MTEDSERRDEAEPLNRILANLEARLSRIERHLDLEPIEQNGREDKAAEQPPAAQRETLELKIGLYWFAKAGIAALITGIVFLLLLPYHDLSPTFAPILGFVLAGSVLLFSPYLRKSFPFLSGYSLGGGLILLFSAALRLHYFAQQPVLSGIAPEVFLLLLIAAVSLIVSIRQNSMYLTALSLTLGYATALMSEQMYSFLTITTVTSLLVVYLSIRYKWYSLVVFGIILTNFAQTMWLMNNPVAGNPIEFRASPYGGALFILLYALIFASAIYFREKDLKENSIVIVISLLNCFIGYGLYLVLTVAEFQERLPLFHLIASVMFIALAIAFWLREKSRFQTFFYAMTGYAALTVAIVAQFKTPDSFIWLCWQSLLVVSTAVWFRSKFVVVTNFVIYTIIFITYLIVAGAVNITSLSFGVVALLSARVLSWQKHRLELKTDTMRTAYLIAAFFIFPYALYHTVPAGYISLSWLAVAILYYIISLILNNMKYRWMALSTFILTALYLLIVGIIKLEPTLRIISLLILGMALLTISFIYARAKLKSSAKNP
ncbi:MAG: hypothetical protein ACLP05_06945 [Candidatus Kryptoniota bacterium]